MAYIKQLSAAAVRSSTNPPHLVCSLYRAECTKDSSLQSGGWYSIEVGYSVIASIANDTRSNQLPHT